MNPGYFGKMNGATELFSGISVAPTTRLREQERAMPIVLVPLSDGNFALVDEDDYPLIAGLSWHTTEIDAKNKTRYAVTTIRDAAGNRKKVSMHRMIMNAKPGELVDHINLNGLDNRRSANLRIVDRTVSVLNRGLQANNRSGFRGVCIRRGKFAATLGTRPKPIHLGTFDIPEAAARAYDTAAKALWGDAAILNFPESEATS